MRVLSQLRAQTFGNLTLPDFLSTFRSCAFKLVGKNLMQTSSTEINHHLQVWVKVTHRPQKKKTMHHYNLPSQHLNKIHLINTWLHQTWFSQGGRIPGLRRSAPKIMWPVLTLKNTTDLFNLSYANNGKSTINQGVTHSSSTVYTQSIDHQALQENTQNQRKRLLIRPSCKGLIAAWPPLSLALLL